MLDKFLVLLERFVVAHELIAANSVKPKYEGPLTGAQRVSGGVKELKVEGEDVIDIKAGGADRHIDDVAAEILEEEEREEEDKPKGPDVSKLREEIKTIAKAIAAGDSDECADKFDELLEDYKVRTVTKLADEDVEAFHKDATKLVGKYYEIEE